MFVYDISAVFFIFIFFMIRPMHSSSYSHIVFFLVHLNM